LIRNYSHLKKTTSFQLLATLRTKAHKTVELYQQVSKDLLY
jgi:hypothetical protein